MINLNFYKPSALIRLALADLAKCEDDEGYVIDMDTWHGDNGKYECVVCFAGAVMAQTLNAPIGANLSPSVIDNVTGTNSAAGLRALDYFRGGNLESGWRELLMDGPCPLMDQYVVEYWYSPGDFKSTMHEIAHEFADKGY